MKWNAILLCIVLVYSSHLTSASNDGEEKLFLETEDSKPRAFLRICNKKTRYRTFDGSCNNLKNPEWGVPNKPYARLLSDSYSDGKHALPRSKSNETLASAREVSLKLFPDAKVADPKWTLLTLQWGQVVAHDLSRAATTSKVECCSNGTYTENERSDPRCASIAIPADDPFNSPERNKCYNFYRTESSCNAKQPNEQITTVSAFMDLSSVYGSSSKQAKDLRTYKGGRLVTASRNGQEWLPQSRDVSSDCFGRTSGDETCYRAGDSRVNQNTQLSVLQNILLREHNRIADYLCDPVTPQWNDEKCYQEARRILIAVTQHINYYEFLPILIGQDYMVEKKLIFPGVDGYVNDYDPNVNPAILNEFATAAYRNYHSTIVGYLRFYLENRESNGSIRISDYLNKPSIIEEGDNFVKLTRGLSTQPQNALDRYCDEEMTQYLFRKPYNKLGEDLRSLDIQRSRDHGIGTYVNALMSCNLSSPTSFKDLEKFIPSSLVSLLKEVYKDIGDVELIVGGALETLLPDTLTGPTFQCIMAEQFLRSRRSDRFFYENGDQPGSFTIEQLESIREGSTIASLLCNNVEGLNQMQPKAFIRISDGNSLVSCSKLPKVHLSLWKNN